MSIKKLFIITIVYMFVCIVSNSNEINIVAKVDNIIITNFDVQSQKKYLLIYNKKLNNLSKKEFNELSKNSLIREKIKQKEINKFFKIEDENLGEKLIKDSYLNQGFKNKSEYLNFIQSEKLEYSILKEKLIIEKLWNTLIFEKYSNKVKINEKEISRKIKLFYENQAKIYELNISEIIFDYDTEYKELIKFIKSYDFESAALKYSISDSSSKGGEIGWVNPNNIALDLKNMILNLEIGEISKPLKIPNGTIIVKLNSKREINSEIDLDQEIKKQLIYEKNRQLKSFSLNYYNKIKKNTVINEY
tara:strand:+ start:2220 stop:3131 length:912 start_codon:yes stop_codon:yes gene_type:complete